jgi:hypothetical protein
MVIDDEICSRLEKLLPKPTGRHGKDDRLYLEAICWMLRTDSIYVAYDLSTQTGSPVYLYMDKFHYQR